MVLVMKAFLRKTRLISTAHVRSEHQYGLRELIPNGQEGFLIGERPGSAFAEALVRMSEDSRSAKNMGLNAKQKVERDFPSEKMARDYVVVYTSLK